ncbi:hypothetical protein BCV69DRAFT_282945 [Microstroma glucosiphilum]|uniref:Ribosomal RNA-processing protein 17 n=1 Tax=Pseudomicrostroma glucosiphilum TaxID=1684307 RepID=A0A316U8M1_9BASI|nr:hypothetical protein BCV69DRAFT_282945 [Pseudomicrostroma glucosiphilum]PWN20723.1 hypothetical protein BCV69DRAFT_282945 [Pseudomicrostroma glucosiphilum]
MSDAAPSGGLAAYTESALRSASSSSKDKGKGKGRGKDRNGRSSDRRPSSKSTYKKGAKSKLEFDEKARQEYLTGFHKRKLQRIEIAQKKREEEAKEERKRNRRETQEARKERAAENVAAERRAYGGDEGEDEDEEDGEEDGEEGKNEGGDAGDVPVSYETPEHQTTVVISEWDPNAPEDEQPASLPSASKKPSRAGRNPKPRVSDFLTEALPPSSKRMEKKIKSSSSKSSSALAGPSSSVAGGSSKQRSTGLAARKSKLTPPSASAISSLLTEPLASHDSRSQPELAASTPSTTLSREERDQGLTHLSSAAERQAVKDAIKASKPFRYEGKMERAKKRVELKARNEKFKAERIEKLKRGGGRGGSKGGKRGKPKGKK